MRSMTGFGVGHAPCPRGRIIVEARSVNHRFLDVRVRVPPEIGDAGFAVEQQVRRRGERGRYDVVVRLETAEETAPFDLDRARVAYRALRALRDELAPDSPLPVSAVLQIPAVFATGTGPAPATAEALSAAVDRALDDLDAMRQVEGAALKEDLSERLASARALVDAMHEHLPAVTQALGERLRLRIDSALSTAAATVDAARLETEIALLADRADVTEELVRLASHFDQFETLIATTEKMGRRLDFLLQEMSRETNTVGAKSQDAQLSHWVVQLKAEIERMREQVQNVE